MNEQIKKNKAVFAAYLNMAQQNVFVTLQHISQLMEIEETEDLSNRPYDFKVLEELKSSQSFKDEANEERPKSERIQKIISLLHKHFPFLKAFLEAKHKQRIESIPPAAYRKVLCETFEVLNAFRNECSHFSPVNKPEVEQRIIKIQKKIVKYLYPCLDGGRRVVSERFKDIIKEKDMVFLTGVPRYIYTKEGNKVIDTKERPDFYYRLKDDEERMSYVGLLLFTCLFLHKKYITIFLDQANLFLPQYLSKSKKTFPETEKKIIREIFSVYRIRLPKERIESQRPEYALGLDMLNDLQKCPSELYDTLSAEDKSIFRVMRERDKKGDKTENGEVLLLRHDDRFPYFALRYLDENHVFDNIRFQISLGKYRYEFYDKACIDTKEEKDRTRSLQKEVNGFGRLSEIEYERKTRWNGKIHLTDKDHQPFITDQHAGYVFNGNRVGILFNNDMRNDLSWSNEALLYIPDLKFDTTLKGKDARCVPPIAWLSVYELPGLIFHHFLCRKYNVDIHLTEHILKECVQLYQQLFTDIKEGKLIPCIPKENLDVYLSTHYHTENFCIHSKDVPEKMQEYLTGEWEKKNMKHLFRERSRARMQKMLEGTRVRLEKFREERKMIGNTDNKFGKKRYIDIRPGQLARYLSKDLLFFQPYDDSKNNKVTGLNFQILQSSLAIYDKSLEELKSLFYRANLLSKNKPEMEHPFLRKILNRKPESTLSFYESYLIHKIIYLENKLKDPNESFNKLFRYENRVRWQQRNKDYYQKLAGRYLAEWLETDTKDEKQLNFKPIELPRGLFEQAIKRLLIQQLDRTNEKEQKMYLAATAARSNVTFLIAQYFEHILVDHNQEFYLPTKSRFKRTYKYFNIINNQKERNKLVQCFYTLDEMEKLVAKNSKGKRPIDENVIRYLNSKEALKLANPQARLQKYLSEYKENEKVIRRYKVQDMLVYLMAKTLLIEKNSKKNTAEMSENEALSEKSISTDSLAKIKRYKLQNISPVRKDGNILTIPIPFQIKLFLEDGTERIISQAAIKLKNYGDFFQFVYDDRVRSLLPFLKKAEIDRNSLNEELDYYDLKRAEIFRLSHNIEKIILQKRPDLNNPDSPLYEWCTGVNAKGNEIKIVRKNNFRAMLNVLRDMGLLMQRDLDDMVDIRNAFGHNHYTKELRLGNSDIPYIAKMIWQHFDELVNKNKSKK
ncbi:type VI-B CRISPR-associated RNA-guided ribonuclease Cas13b [Bacteroides bouchesdurhonensis]